MTQIYPHLHPDINTWPVARQSRERADFIHRLNAFTYSNLKKEFNDSYYDVISKTIYMESQRIKLNPWKVDPQDEKVYWQNISKELESSLNKPEKAEIQDALFKKIINRYNEEIVAHFSPGIFKFSRWFLTAFFKRLLSRYFAKGQWRWGTKLDLQQRIKIVGDIEKLRTLFEKGNVVIMPTHYSNLDSVMIGYAMDTNVGLPFFSYGAGLNLYNVEIVGYFINRLGAFRVDRRKKNPIYLECLKSMASYSIMDDVNCLFFPGGTRSRSGKTEDKLKLGLIGSVIEAQRLLLEKNEEKKVFVVPLNIGYHFVLEAGQLIDQHLQAIGRDKYKRTRQSGPTFGTIMRFVRDLYRKESEVYMSFGEPIDILGNSVDINGDSYDKFGNKIDLKDYFSLGGELSSNLQRESIYSKYLGEVVSESYKKYNVILSSNVVSFVAFHLIFEEYKNLELIPFINQSGKTFTIEGSDFEQNVDKLVQIIQNLSTDKHVTVSDESWSDVPVLIEEGIHKLGIYHNPPVLLVNDKKQIICTDLKLLLFYHNRLANYNFEESMGWQTV